MSENITLKTMRCPTCGGSLKTENNTDAIVCVYCGNTIVPVNEPAPISATAPTNETSATFTGVSRVDVNEANVPFNDKNIKNEEQEVQPEVVDAKSATKKKPSGFSVGFIEQIELIVIAFVAIVLIFSFGFRTCRVSGPSMENTLFDSETVITSNLFYTPEKGDIIVFHQTGELNEPVVKRVIGLPGDTVSIQYFSNPNRMVVTVIDKNGNREVLEEPYIKYERQTYDDTNVYVTDGTVFVMGDNRSDSLDSRSDKIGLVDQRRILGKVIFRVTPLSRIGTVK